MGQIVKRKKKGRPSKSDLARQQRSSPAAAAALQEKNDRRRSLRRRNVRYNNFIDYDDYLDEYEEYDHLQNPHQDNEGLEDDEEDDDDEEDERRKEKKLKLVLKIQNQRAARGFDARETASDEEEEEEEEDEREMKQLKKKRKKINGGDDSEAEEDSENDDDDDNNNDHEERVAKANATKGQEDCVPGTPPSNYPNGLPLPDKKLLEVILDKIQKKDIYGVYAEPVDLEELPDYLDVVDHPMDFATVRKKLGNGSYSTLEQFESDVFLICSNAMQYNSSDTIYHKQARTIQELAKKKFQKLRVDFERSEKELKSEKKTKNLLAKKPVKKPLYRAVQEPVGSDFSSGATLATTGDVQNGFVAIQASGNDRPNNVDGPIEGNSIPLDNIPDRAEDLSSGKGNLSKHGKKLSQLDENRRGTYNVSNQPVAGPESIFTTFEGEIKQFVAVGLQAEYSYARSMSRFAATLGPVAWKMASQRIEQALPPDFKFGRGWVGEYEPLPTPVLMVETRMQKEPLFFTKLQGVVDMQMSDVISRTSVPAEENLDRVSTSERKPSLLHPRSGPILEGRPSLFSSAGPKSNTPIPAVPTTQKQNLSPKNFAEAQNKSLKQVELNLPPSNYQHDSDVLIPKRLANNSEMTTLKPREVPRTVGIMHSIPSKQPDSNGSVGLPNGKVNNRLNRTVSSSSDGVPNQKARAATFAVQGEERGVSDPVEAMRISAERIQSQHKPSSQSANNSPITPSVPPGTKDSSNAAVAAARAWMSIGAGGFRPPTENLPSPKNQISAESLYNPARQHHAQIPRVQGQFPIPGMVQYQGEKNNFPFQAFMRPHAHTGNEGQFPNGPMVFPQFAAADLSRLQMQSPWRVLSPHAQPKPKQETFSPDLNIDFQSPGSPVKQSSGVMVDSQQPDLALQL